MTLETRSVARRQLASLTEASREWFFKVYANVLAAHVVGDREVKAYADRAIMERDRVVIDAVVRVDDYVYRLVHTKSRDRHDIWIGSAQGEGLAASMTASITSHAGGEPVVGERELTLSVLLPDGLIREGEPSEWSTVLTPLQKQERMACIGAFMGLKTESLSSYVGMLPRG